MTGGVSETCETRALVPSDWVLNLDHFAPGFLHVAIILCTGNAVEKVSPMVRVLFGCLERQCFVAQSKKVLVESDASSVVSQHSYLPTTPLLNFLMC